MLVFFSSWSYFQLNDPDALPWILIYGATAVCCLLYGLRRLPLPLAALLAAFALGWALVVAIRVLGQQPIFEEEGREMMGLLIVAGWTGFLARRLYRQQKAVSG